MKPVGKQLVLGALACIISTAVVADEYQKKGLPCVGELCIGDGLEEVSRVKWERDRNMFSSKDKPLYTSTLKLSDNETKYLNTKYKGDVAEAGPYLHKNAFDSLALPGLKKVNAACQLIQLKGKYISESGNPTTVVLALVPEPGNPSVQKWKVTKIYRELPNVITNQQKEEAKQQLEQRYADFSGIINGRHVARKEGDGKFNFNTMGRAAFSLDYEWGSDLDNKLKTHPQCGGSAKIKLD